MYSDNGSNFRGAEKELRDLLSKIDFYKVSKTLTNHNINWKFVPSLSPWMGGAWKSIIKLTKKALRIVNLIDQCMKILYQCLLPKLNQY